MTGDGHAFVTALQSVNAIAVSDGSFKDGFGLAAWVLEGVDQTGRVLGVLSTPGDEKSQSAYRSELTRNFCILLLTVNKLCEPHNIKE